MSGYVKDMYHSTRWLLQWFLRNISKQVGKRKSGSAGGLARAKTLTPKQRQEIAKKAAIARWE